MNLRTTLFLASLLALAPLAPRFAADPAAAPDPASVIAPIPSITLAANTAEAGRYGRSSYSSGSSWGRSSGSRSKSYRTPSRSSSGTKSYKSRKSGSSGYNKPSASQKQKRKQLRDKHVTPKTKTGTNSTRTTSTRTGTGKKTTGGYAKPGGAKVSNTANGRSKITRTSSYADTLKKQRASAAKQRQNRIKQARGGNTYKSLAGGKTYDRKTVRTRRSSYLDNNPAMRGRYQRFDDYGFGRRDYGGFDPSFLMMMAMSDDPGSAALWYGMTGSPWLSMWMSDARESAAAQGDQEVLQRLDAVERRIEQAPADAKPAGEVLAEQGIPAEVALAPDVLTGEPDITPQVKFGTGGKDGVYYTVCAGDDSGMMGVKERVGDAIDMTCVPTDGSKQNVVDVVSNTHQCVLAQSDVIDGQLRANPDLSFGRYQMEAYPEAFWLIVNDDAGIDSVSDLDPSKHTLLMGGSGAAAAWSNLAYHASGEWFGNDRYAKFQPKTVNRETGLKQVAGDRDTVMLVVMGMNSTFMATANDEYGEHVRLAAFDDGDFDDLQDREGNDIYAFVDVPGGTYPDLQDGWWDSSVTTLSVQAVVVCNPGAMASMGKAARDVLLTGLNMTLPTVRQRTLGLE